MPTYKVFGRPEDIEANSYEEALAKYECKGSVVEEPISPDVDNPEALFAYHELEFEHGKGELSGQCRCPICVKSVLSMMIDMGFFEEHADGNVSLRLVGTPSGAPIEFYTVFKMWARDEFGIEVR
jgi:hypothetical protein